MKEENKVKAEQFQALLDKLNVKTFVEAYTKLDKLLHIATVYHLDKTYDSADLLQEIWHLEKEIDSLKEIKKLLSDENKHLKRVVTNLQILLDEEKFQHEVTKKTGLRLCNMDDDWPDSSMFYNLYDSVRQKVERELRNKYKK